MHLDTCRVWVDFSSTPSKLGFAPSIEEVKILDQQNKERAVEKRKIENVEKETRKQVKKQKWENKFQSDVVLARQKV